jgi:nucleoside 2-deoxyribosyltransferase
VKNRNKNIIKMKGRLIMEKCFVMQPFDNDKYDKRFTDVFKPAIEKAGLEAYRVDKDSSVRIPIEDIERGISESAICLAEITTDNPNVWYELGYAFACKKEVVMVCSDDRKEKFPFDIQHRRVIKYTTGSTSDFDKLEEEITKTIKAYQETTVITQQLNSTPIPQIEGLEGREIAILILLIENSIDNEQTTPFYRLKQEMEKSGYTSLATSIAIRTLAKNGMLTIAYEAHYEDEPFEVCKITAKGEEWILSNQDKFQFQKNIDQVVDENE